MKAKEGTKCVICNKPAVERSFDNTGFCEEHYVSWLKSYRESKKPLDEAFILWKARVE